MSSRGADVATARNYVVLLMVLLGNVFVFCVRSQRRSALTHDPRRNPSLLLGTVGAQAFHIVAMHLPLTQRVPGLAPHPAERLAAAARPVADPARARGGPQGVATEDCRGRQG